MSSKLNPFDLTPATSQPTRPAAVPRILMLGDKQRKFLHYIMEDKYYETIAFGGSRGGGKAGTNTSMVCTPFGFKPMGSMTVGKQVSNPDGSVSRVVGVYPQGVKKVLKVTFADGRTSRVSEDHLWNATISCNKIKRDIDYKVYTTSQLKELVDKGRNLLIPMSEPTQFTMGERTPNPRPIHPYALGCLLGDGCLVQGAGFSTTDNEILGEILKETGWRFTQKAKIEYNFLGVNPNLRKLKLFGTKSNNKFVPKEYMMTSIDNRYAILQGLMDTDGTVDSRGHTSYTSVSKQLAKDVQWLVWSIGGKATITSCIPNFTYKGEYKQGQLAYTVQIQIADSYKLFRLQRKIDRCVQEFNGGVSERKLRILSIEPDGEEECTCIGVDNPNSLYLMDDFVVTHNTMVSCMAMILRRMKFPGTDGLMLRRVQKAADMNLGAEIRKCLSLVGLPADKQVWRWLESKKQWIFTPNGNIIQLGYCSRENDWEQHQGLQWTDMAFEEANQFPESTWDNLGGSNRTANQDCSPKRWITFNPGGIGSEWTDRRFGIRDQSTAEAKSIFVKSLLKDSKPLLANDPGYRDRVLAKLPEWRRLQWEEGSFDAIEDAFFQVDPRMIRKQEVPYYADIWGGVDAGYFPSAFASVVFATWQDYHGKQRVHVMGEVKKHRLNLREQAEETIQMSAAVSPQHRVKAWYADPAAWKRRESETGANENTAYFWTMNGLVVTQAYTNARAAGWLVMRTLMENCSLTVDPSCRALINEMTGAMHDKKTEDIDERCEDHLLDALRYGLVSTAWGFVKDTAKAKPFEQFIAQAGAKQRQISSTIDLLKGDLTIA